MKKQIAAVLGALALGAGGATLGYETSGGSYSPVSITYTYTNRDGSKQAYSFHYQQQADSTTTVAGATVWVATIPCAPGADKALPAHPCVKNVVPDPPIPEGFPNNRPLTVTEAFPETTASMTTVGKAVTKGKTVYYCRVASGETKIC